jgi:pilin isopeptide linkage protein
MRTVRVKKLMKALSLGMAFLLTVGSIHVRTFAADTPTATAVMEVEAKVTGDQAEDAAFTFKLTAEDAATPMPDSDTVTIHGAGTAKFGPITYNDVGIYTYTVSQQDGQQQGYTYDKTIYHVTVTVIYTDDGKMSAGIFTKKNNERTKSGDIVFNIEYHAPKPTEEPTPKPTEEPTPKPTEEPTPEPTEEPTPEPTEEPTPEPTEEPTPEPTEELTPEPTEEPTPEPTTELTPGPKTTEGPTQNPTGGTSSGSGTTAVKTGDDTPIERYMFVLTAFAGVILLVIRERRRRRKA